MNEIKCIYCGKGESDGVELSISDIIPDGLTNKTITNKNVCKIEHNNKFSDQFESFIINEFAFLRNHLGIINKNGQLPSFTAKYELEGAVFEKKISNKKDFFRGNIISGKIKTESVLFGSIENLEKISNYDPENLKEVSINGDITQIISLKFDVFLSVEMKRLVAKIAYEWYCKVMKINCKLPKYDNIIKYILNDYQGDDLVSIITDLDLYNAINSQVELGNHSLTIYEDPDGFTYIIYMFFGLVLYKIKICSHRNLKTDWQSIPFYCIRSDGIVIHPIVIVINVSYKFKSVLLKDGLKEISEYVKKCYIDIMNMQIFTLRNFYSNVVQISKFISSMTGDELYNELIGYKDDRTLFATIILKNLGECIGLYDNNKNFDSNLKSILEIDDKMVFDKDELFIYLDIEYKNDRLIPDLKKGIRLFLEAYNKEILENR